MPSCTQDGARRIRGYGTGRCAGRVGSHCVPRPPSPRRKRGSGPDRLRHVPAGANTVESVGHSEHSTLMKIRRYQETDHDQVWDLHNLALEAAGAHPGSGAWDEDLHNVSQEYVDGGGDFLVGTHDNLIVAIGALKRSSSDRAEIKRMRVYPDFQRRGLGLLVLRALEARATELGYVTLHLSTTVQQIAARRLYARSGYLEVGRSTVKGFNIVHFEKRLQ